MINGGWETEEYSNLSSAVSALTYNTAGDNVTRRVYGILNSNGEAEVLVIEIARNFVTNQTGDYGSNGRLTLNSLSIANSIGVNFTNTSGVAINAGAVATIQIRKGNTPVYNGVVNLGSAVANGARGSLSFAYGGYSFGQEYNVTLTIVDGNNVCSATANMWA